MSYVFGADYCSLDSFRFSFGLNSADSDFIHNSSGSLLTYVTEAAAAAAVAALCQAICLFQTD